ncbi:MAG: sporulation integral membrane protein YlbJ [Peptococcaceae bacterium]|nr:sporulation integral membrane protein YlbJ [Peptococcaceae bacterium]
MSTLLKVIPFLFLIAVMFVYPQEVLVSASNGIILWANYVLPALLPFFIISDLLMKQGFVHFLGILLEPLMRPLFRLPGKASFIIAMTHTSGIPIGAILTCKMRQAGEITKYEGERLLAFTSNPSPGFMFGAVASGMLSNPALGIIIAGSVYTANIIVGLIFRFYGPPQPFQNKYSFSLSQAWKEMESVQKKNKKPFGDLLAEAIRESISTILLVGGFIVLFAVISHMLNILPIVTKLTEGISLLTGGKLSPAAGNAFIQGFLETTLGCKAAVNNFSSLHLQIGAIAFILGWGGLSVFAQVASFTAATDLRFFPFVLGRILHSFLALIISQIYLKLTVLPTMLPFTLSGGSPLWLYSLQWSTVYFGFLLLFMICCALLCLLVFSSDKR